MEENTVRINKYLSETGFCSRREADRLIEQGRVTINGKVPEMGTKVAPGDEVRVNGVLVEDKKQKHIYLAFNKPAGIECTTNQKIKDNIVDYINYPERIFPIGRLDKASEGLIFMTNDGDIVNKILRARNNHEKEVIAQTKEKLEGKQTHLKHKKAELSDIMAETEKEENFLLGKSEELRGQIEERLLAAYDRIRNSVRNGLAVVSIERGASAGSFFTIPPQTQMEIAARKKIITDEHSGGILVDGVLADEEREKMEKLFASI